MLLRSIFALMLALFPFNSLMAGGKQGVQMAGSAVMAGASAALAYNAVAGMWCEKEAAKAKAQENAPLAAMFMGMALMSFSQALADDTGADKAEGLTNTATYGKPNSNSNNLPTTDDINKKIGAINKEGVKFNPETGKIDTPYGSFSPEAFSSPKQAALEGMNSDTMSALEKALEKAKEAEKDISEKANALAGGDGPDLDGGGGGGGGSSGRAAASSFDQWLKDKNQKAQRGPASLDGMKKYLKGDVPVGIAVDNIFEMIRRKYHQKASAHQFL